MLRVLAHFRAQVAFTIAFGIPLSMTRRALVFARKVFLKASCVGGSHCRKTRYQLNHKKFRRDASHFRTHISMRIA